MTDCQLTSRKLRVFSVILPMAIFLALLTSACKSEQSSALDVIKQHLSAIDPDFRDPTVKFFHKNNKFPDKAYIAVSGTRGFTSSTGKPQPDFHAYLLIKEGDSWRLDTKGRVRYTTEPAEADKILSGQK